MDKIWYAIADFFQFIFKYIEMLGNSVNYLYIVIIFVFGCLDITNVKA